MKWAKPDKSHKGHFFCEKAAKNSKKRVFEKIIAVGSVLVWMKKCDVKYIGVVIVADYFAEAPKEVLAKTTKGEPENRLKNQFLGVYMTSEKTLRRSLTV